MEYSIHSFKMTFHTQCIHTHVSIIGEARVQEHYLYDLAIVQIAVLLLFLVRAMLILIVTQDTWVRGQLMLGGWYQYKITISGNCWCPKQCGTDSYLQASRRFIYQLNWTGYLKWRISEVFKASWILAKFITTKFMIFPCILRQPFVFWKFMIIFIQLPPEKSSCGGYGTKTLVFGISFCGFLNHFRCGCALAVCYYVCSWYLWMQIRLKE